MAAKESAGVQAFPEAVFSVPSRPEAEERSALAFNVKDGQQSVGQSVEDPYTKAVKYIEKHRIAEVFQVTMETLKPSYIILSYPRYLTPAANCHRGTMHSSCQRPRVSMVAA